MTESRLEYLVIYERGDKSYGAYVPDLPGCVAVGRTKEEVSRLIREAIAGHVAAMIKEGLPVPEPTSSPDDVKV
jgi:predicted RNase H-like HicB family nuclease